MSKKNMLYKNDMCQKDTECARNTTAAFIDNNQFYNDAQKNMMSACNQQTFYQDCNNPARSSSGRDNCCPPSTGMNVCRNERQLGCQPSSCPMSAGRQVNTNVGCTSQDRNVGICCPVNPCYNMKDVPCRNDRQLGCQPPPCPRQQFSPYPAKCNGMEPSPPPNPCAGCNQQPDCCRQPEQPSQATCCYPKGHPLACCEEHANIQSKPIPPQETWPINSCFACDDRGCGIKSELCDKRQKRICCTPMSQYMMLHGEMARQLLCDEISYPLQIRGQPPCNVCEQIMPLCRGYYQDYECPMPIDPKTGKPRLKSEQYWKPCTEIGYMNDYRKYMSTPANGLIKKLKRKMLVRKEWN